MGKGEIARYEQFLLFPQSFSKACFPGASKDVTVWKWVKGPQGRRLCKPLWKVTELVVQEISPFTTMLPILSKKRSIV